MTDRKLFQEGKTYYAEYEVWGYYMGIRVSHGMCDTPLPAKCIRRTECYATFEVQTSRGLLTKKSKLMNLDGGEMVRLTNNGAIKDLVITSYQTMD